MNGISTSAAGAAAALAAMSNKKADSIVETAVPTVAIPEEFLSEWSKEVEDEEDAKDAPRRVVLSINEEFAAPADMAAVEKIVAAALAAARSPDEVRAAKMLADMFPDTLEDLIAGGLDKIPPRQFLLRGFFMRGALTVFAGPGGSGKSSFLCAVALSLAEGKAFVGIDPRDPSGATSLLINGDDGKLELSRRLGGCSAFYKTSPAGNKRVFAIGTEKLTNMKVCKLVRGELQFDEAWFIWFKDLVRKTMSDLVVLDPFAAMGQLSENDNGQVAEFAVRLNRLAVELDIAIVLVAHVNKASMKQALEKGGDRDVGAVRGASALSAQARAVYIFDYMTDADAPHLGLQAGDPLIKRLSGLWQVKGNYVPDVAMAVFEKIPQSLNNARGLDLADDVVALVPYKVTKAAGSPKVIQTILEMIQDGVPGKGPYSKRNTGTKDRSIVPAIIDGVNWEDELLSGTPTDKSIKIILEREVFRKGFAREEDVKVQYDKVKKDGKGLVLTAAGKKKLAALRAGITTDDAEINPMEWPPGEG